MARIYMLSLNRHLGFSRKSATAVRCDIISWLVFQGYAYAASDLGPLKPLPPVIDYRILRKNKDLR